MGAFATSSATVRGSIGCNVTGTLLRGRCGSASRRWNGNLNGNRTNASVRSGNNSGSTHGSRCSSCSSCSRCSRCSSKHNSSSRSHSNTDNNTNSSLRPTHGHIHQRQHQHQRTQLQQQQQQQHQRSQHQHQQQQGQEQRQLKRHQTFSTFLVQCRIKWQSTTVLTASRLARDSNCSNSSSSSSSSSSSKDCTQRLTAKGSRLGRQQSKHHVTCQCLHVRQSLLENDLVVEFSFWAVLAPAALACGCVK